MESIAYGIGDWKADGLGNHRAVLRVDRPAEGVRVRIPWRRRDSEPEKKGMTVVAAATGEQVDNLVRAEVTRDCGEIVFQPVSGAGEYYLYYMPFVTEGWQHMPATRYLPPEETADPAWVETLGLAKDQLEKGEWRQLPQAEVVELQAAGEFHRMDPMEVVATTAEVEKLIGRYPQQTYLVFPEDRRFPIRMRDDLPLQWVKKGAAEAFFGEAKKGEFYAFQLGVYAVKTALEDVDVELSDLRSESGQMIPATAISCFNTGGLDWNGRPFAKRVSVAKGRVQPLWIGVQIPEEAVAGRYEGSIVVQPQDREATEVQLAFEVADELIEDAGDGDLWRQARLRWLDSTKGIDAEVVDPYAPVRVKGRKVEILGRTVRFGELGLIESIGTRFTRSLQRPDGPAREMLTAPMRFAVEAEDRAEELASNGCEVVAQSSGIASWEAKGEGESFEYGCRAEMECDGYITYRITLKAKRDVSIDDTRVEIPLRKEFAKYLMGMGHKGGLRRGEWRWKWSEERANHMVWLGEVHGGLQCKLMHERDIWELYNLRTCGLPDSWDNSGQGGCDVVENGDGDVELIAYSGPRKLSVGEEIVFRFGLLITPFHPLDGAHWDWRYYGDGLDELTPIDEIAKKGAKIRHLHHANPLNPHINYPFVRAEELKNYADEAHTRDMRLLIYYTVRELSNFAAEIWAFRSLGEEIYRRQEGFRLADHFADEEEREAGLQGGGGSWLWEHLVDDFVPAWHHPLGESVQDASIATQGLSRLHNYYVEGLEWLVRRVGIDGIYLDGIGYDRQIMKRVRKVLKRTQPDSLVTFHSGNNFHPEYGLNSPAVQYLEHLAYCDSVWFGEGYDYDETPDYWLVEISGIPFGLTGEMLQGGGNLWRGMLYCGMANRLGWNADSQPEPIWKFWDEWGIEKMEMIGYWDEECPVRVDGEGVLATAYVGKERMIVSLASWAEGEVECGLEIDWEKLGIEPETAIVTAPEIAEFQPEREFAAGKKIPVSPAKGWLLVIAPR